MSKALSEMGENIVKLNAVLDNSYSFDALDNFGYEMNESIKNYDEAGIYQIHLARNDLYGGGSAGNLDYYPYEKPVFENNIMPTEVRSLYLNSGVLGQIDEYISLAKESNINAFVVDIKDSGAPAYASPVMQELSPTNYERAINSFEYYQSVIKKLKDNGFYVISEPYCLFDERTVFFCNPF